MARNRSEPDKRSLQNVLQETTTAATTRAAKGQKIFSPIAAFLDKHRNQTAGLSPYLQGALATLSDNLATVAQHHFNAYISSITSTLSTHSPAPALSPIPSPLPPTPPPSCPPSGLTQSSYATITKSNPARSDHATKMIDSYAIYTSLRAQLGINSNALKEVQTTKTRFALCPATMEALSTLEAQKEVISTYFGNCQVECSARWISYRVTNLPRKIGQITNGQYSMIPVDPATLSTEIAEQTGYRPISVSKTTASAANVNSPSSSWFINFSEDSKASLSTRLHLFGTITNACFLTRKVTIIQYNHCWKWHNAQSCAQSPRCRLCGSLEHIEEEHNNSCSTLNPHCCPLRCFHCHGPHLADFTDCPLRPKAGTTRTKAQRAEIRKTCAINLAKARTEQGCSSELSATTQEQHMVIDTPPTQIQVASPFRPTTPPPPAPSQEPPVTASVEPYIFSNLSQKITKRHPSYECFSPTDSWTVTGRPRVLTYVWKNAGLQASQLWPIITDPATLSDLLFLQIFSSTGQSVLTINAYNAPAGSTRASKAMETLISLPETLFLQPTLLTGDFNLLHIRWQPSLTYRPAVSADPFIKWLDHLGFILISEIDCLTHTRGNVLDLTYATSSLALSRLHTSTVPHLDSTSDYTLLLTTIPWDQRHTLPTQKIRFDTLDQPLFLSLLSTNLSQIQPLDSSKANLESLAQGLTSAIHKVFDISKWHKSRGSYRSPPLKDPLRPDNPPAVSVQEKRDLLVRNLLQNTTEAGDIPLDCPAVPTTTLPFPEITMAQVEKSILKARNTAPGEDELQTNILKTAWPLIKDKILFLFQGCLRLGYHPKCFRHAILTILQKPSKEDWTNPRSYRPIALLSVLGKGLERLVAQNMAWIAIHYKVLASQQFRALPLRLVINLTTCLTHDIEQALNQGKTASLLTFDVEGAFDNVLPGRLTYWLRTQGWPNNLILWISSFITERTIQIRFDNELGPHTDISCGLPQGSPISPILFILYIAPLFHMGNPRTRFGYADDGATLAISPSLLTNCQTLSESLQDAIEWGTAEGITFAPNKYELMHFSRHRADQDPATTPSVLMGSVTVTEATDQMTSKVLTIASALRSLGNTVHGMRPHLLQQAISACVLRKVYFGAETWWPGRTRFRSRPQADTPPISNLVNKHLTDLSTVILTGARAILPVFRTTQLPVLHRESGFYPPKIELDQIALTASTRLSRLDPYHPLRRRARAIARTGHPTSRFARRVLALPNMEKINPLLHPPWSTKEPREAALRWVGAPSGRTREEAADNFQILLQSIPNNDIIIYSDGSKLENGQTGGGYVGSSQAIFESFNTLAATWPSRRRLLQIERHANIPRNEAADYAAKEGAGKTVPISHPWSYAAFKRHTKSQAASRAQTYWQAAAPRPPELQLPRHILGRILAARTKHGDFADYHEWFNHTDAHLTCRCGARKSPIHFIFCQIAKRKAPRFPRHPSEVIPFLLGTPKGATKLAKWLTETRFFEDICPRRPPLST
ncbi:polymerase, putative [Talaromyces stipitatus ATCC 10500]|uniref:Polymerase, putative n=1 Tax=Talaromyces stipitatus (strain ATCC 10500 / CBS 375.48 / QM 6759 / NRRL 1006) TaxID=441959 RepID=B8MVG2_TALSN|nr:polymerase, putative [Talaromyces stipitatus ATCC 10500]EED11470.1 polymerase, putative [Talaromyces stipitatus ATCC 10500]